MSNPSTATAPTLAPLQFRPKTRGLIPQGLTLAAVLIIVAMLGIILFNVLLHGTGIISWEFLTQPPKDGMEAGGIFPAIFGTVFLVLLMVITGVPVGVLTAIYLSEYTSPTSRTTRLIRTAINNLAGVPSIVFGLFGLGFFIGFIGHGIDTGLLGAEKPVWGQPAIIWAALTLALLTSAGRDCVDRRSAASNSPRTQGRQLCAGRDQTADDYSSDNSAGAPRHLHRRDLGNQPWRGRSRADHVYGRRLLSSVSTPGAQRSVHGTGVSCLRHVNPVTRCRKDQTDSLWHGAGIAGADISAELCSDTDQIEN